MTEWIYICNPKMFDLVGAFQKYPVLDFKQSTDVEIGDKVFFYIAAPSQEIKFKCIVTDINLEQKGVRTKEFELDNSNYVNYGRYMRVRLVDSFDGIFKYDDLIDNGLKTVQGPTKVNDMLSNFINKKLNEDYKPRYFFVYQNKSYKEESANEYIWAPQKGHKGEVFSHWNLLTRVRKGDLIIHSHHQKIVAISRAKRDCLAFKKPTEKGDQWTIDGWKVETKYFEISNPILSKEHRQEYLKLQPEHNSPFDKDGNGNMGYLYVAGKDLFDYIINQTLLNLPSQIEKESLNQFCIVPEQAIAEELVIDEKVIEDVNEIMEETPIAQKYSPTPVVRSAPRTSGNKQFYPRDRNVSVNALLLAKCKCEIDPSHPTFIRKKGQLEYTEPHHLIPMSMQRGFENSLDVEANIVSLCSNCHNHIHYGQGSEGLISKLYNKKSNELRLAGIEISLSDLLRILD